MKIGISSINGGKFLWIPMDACLLDSLSPIGVEDKLRGNDRHLCYLVIPT